MKIARRIVFALSGLLGILALIALFLPSRVTVERSATIVAHPATVFALLNNFRNFNRWSPWAERGMGVTEYTFAGPDRGEGAMMAWTSDSPDVGSGRQEIVSSVPYERIDITLEFEGQGSADTAFVLDAGDTGTRVTWSFTTDFGYDLLGRYLGLMFDDWIGADYEAGLGNLKALAEDLPEADFSDLKIELVRTEARQIAGMVTSSEPDPAAISKALAAAYFQIIQYMEQNGLVQAGPPLAILRGFDGRLTIEAAIPISPLTVADAGQEDAAGSGRNRDGGGVVRISLTYAGEALRAQHIGAYRDMATTHDKILAYIAAIGHTRNGDAWEEYISDPAKVAEANLQTDIYYPIG